MSIPYLEIVVLSVCAIVFYRAGCLEKSWGLLWAALSIGAGVLAMRFLHWGILGILASQVLVFVSITLYRMKKRA